MPNENQCVIKVCSSKLKLKELVKKVNMISKGSSLVQILDRANAINRIHLIGAYVNALEAFKNKTNIAKTLSVELLLYAAMTNQINDAIKKMGAKSNKGFVLFCNSQAAYDSAKKLVTSQKDFNPTKKESEKVARSFGITQANDLNQFILQKMALSRLEA